MRYSARYHILCINSAPHYLRPPLRGHQNTVSLLRKARYLCVNSARTLYVPQCRANNLTDLQLHTTDQKKQRFQGMAAFLRFIFAIIIYPTYVIAFTYR